MHPMFILAAKEKLMIEDKDIFYLIFQQNFPELKSLQHLQTLVRQIFKAQIGLKRHRSLKKLD